jgi:DNA-binding SARP family transcriptional activator/TolB-like protein
MIEFRTLGALDLRGADGHPVQSVLAQAKRLALLGYLAAASPQGFHRKDKLLALFWPESDQERARASLRQVVLYLRRSLGEDLLASRGDEIGLNEERLWCDVAAFETAIAAGRHAEALELYRGDLLDGFHLPDAPEFERWLEDDRARLRAQAASAAWALAEQAEDAGAPAEAVPWARRAVALCPEDEAAFRRLLALLGRTGDRAGALRAHEEFAARLAQEFGVQPSAETQALVRALRESQVAAASPASEGARSGAPNPARDVPDRPFEVRNPVPVPVTPATARPLPARGKRRSWALALALSVLFIGGTTALASRSSGSAPGGSRILVAPLENRTGDAGLDSFGAMAADWITQGLAQTGLVDVVPAMTGMRVFRNLDAEGDPSVMGPERIRAFAEATGAGIIVSGSFYRQGDSLRIHVEFIDPERGVLVRGIAPVIGPVDAPLDAADEVRRRVTAALATLLNPRLTSQAGAASQPPSYAAYQEYLAGADAFIRDDMREAIARFHRAAAYDSAYTLPLLSSAFAHLGEGENAAADSLVQIVDRHRDRLAPLDRHHLELVRSYLRGDLGEALQHSRAMVRLAPESEWLYNLGRDALEFDRPGEAVEALERIDPERWAMKGWVYYWNVLALAHHVLGDHREELRVARRARAMHPGHAIPLNAEIRALAALGREAEVLALVEETVALSPPPASLGFPHTPKLVPPDVMEIAALELRAHGRTEAAGWVLRRAIEWHESRAAGDGIDARGRYSLARLMYRSGRWTEAQRLFEALRAEEPGATDYLGYLGVIAARRGDRAGAQQIAETLRTLGLPYLLGKNTYWRARIAALLGEQERAVELLAQAQSEGTGYIVQYHREADFESLRDYPPFRARLQPKG